MNVDADLAGQWVTLKPMLEALLDAPEAQRAELLDRFAANDAVLRATLERLLDTEEDTNDVVSRRLDPARLAETIARHVDDEAWIGRTLGAYRISRAIGSGGMGTVFVADREGGGFGQKVAIKVFKASWISDSLRARFERERQILATLRHPNIAALFDGGDTREGLPWYAMELVEGVDIAEHFRSHSLDIPARVRLLLDVAAALSYAHQHLVVHRDIKPSNILVSAEGRVKLVDFGIAKLLGGDAGAAGVTEATLGPMTPEYAAPEQFRGDAVTVATDVFQFGTLAYRLLTGHFPYDADPADRYAWSRAVNENDPKSLTWAIARGGDATWSGDADTARIRRTLRGDLGAILAMALAKAPGDRYRSMDAMIGDLEAWLEGRPVIARGRGAAYHAWRLVSRRPWVSAGIAIAFAAILTATVVALYQARRARLESASVLAVTTSLITLMRQADVDANIAPLNPVSLLDQTVASVEKHLAAQPAPRAKLLSTAGDKFIKLGELDRAEHALQQALDAYREAGDTRSVPYAYALVTLAWVQYRQFHADAALALLDDAERSVAGDTSAAADERRSVVWNYRGMIHSENGDLERGRSEVERSVELLESRQNGTAGARRNYATVLQPLDRYDEAISEAERSVSGYEAKYGRDHIRTAGSLVTLATLLADVGETERASQIATALGAQIGKHFDDADIEVPLSEMMLGKIARAEHRDDEAVAHFANAATAYAAKVGAAHPYIAAPWVETSITEHARGRDEAALTAADRALAISAAKLAADHPDIARALDARGLALAALCHTAEARSDIERALAIRRARLPYAHSSIVDSLRHAALLRYASGDVSGANELWDDARERATGATLYRKNPELMAALRAEIADPDVAVKAVGCAR